MKAFRCIRGLTPKVCPFCRQSFAKGRKLHVDAVESTQRVSSAMQSRELLERIALVSGTGSTVEDVLTVITEVHDWMSAHSDSEDPNSVSITGLLFARHTSHLYFHILT